MVRRVRLVRWMNEQVKVMTTDYQVREKRMGMANSSNWHFVMAKNPVCWTTKEVRI